MRQRYPLLCERFLDGYTAAQVARGHMMSAETLRIELDIELYAAKRDPLTECGPGKAVVAMAGRAVEKVRLSGALQWLFKQCRWTTFST